MAVLGVMDTNHADDFHLTKKEAAAYLRLSEDTLSALLAKGALQAFRVAKKLLFRKSDLDAFVEQRRAYPR
jgi:excisionase family DNA binding protein